MIFWHRVFHQVEQSEWGPPSGKRKIYIWACMCGKQWKAEIDSAGL